MWKNLGALLRLTEMRVILALLAVLVVVDGSLRLMQRQLSGNLAHTAQIPDLLAHSGSPQDSSLLLLGNSLINDGVAAPVLAEHLPYSQVGKITPDGTGLWDWQCLLEHQLLDRPEVQFDTVVIGFAWQLLSDQTRVDPSRLGASFCRVQDLARPQRIGLRDSADIGEFLTARTLALYAQRETLRNRLLQLIIPHYEEYTQAANRSGAEGGTRQQTIDYTYATFAALVKRLRAEGTRVMVVAMPVLDDYPIDDSLRALAEQGLVDLLDLREVAGLGAEHYRDPLHLNAEGQRLLSAELAQALQVQLADAT